MKKSLVYDLPTRTFHWLFAILFLLSFGIAKVLDDDSTLFAFHSLVGLTLGFIVLLRILWGFIGTQHARFSSFALHPRDLFMYFKGLLAGDRSKWSGHNPASSWAALTMMALVIGLGLTGFLMTSGPVKETFEDVHEVFANAFVVLIFMHLAGIALHTLRHRDSIGMSMLHGKKSSVPDNQIVPETHLPVSIIFLSFVIAFFLGLFESYNIKTGELQFFGAQLQLMEQNDEEHHD